METQVNKAMHDIISSIVQTTEKVRKCRIVNFKGLFVVDDFNRVYLCKSLHCETLPLPKPSRSIKASLSMPLIDNNNDVLEQPQQNDGNHVPSASTQRAVEREKRAAALVNEDEVDRILQRNHYSKKHAKAKHHHQSPMEYKIDSIDISAAKECVHSRRVATAAHLGSSQLNGCCGDFCSREFDIGDYAKESRYRNISKSTPGSSSSGSSSSAFNDRLRAMDQLLPPLDEKNQKSTPASTVSRQGSSTNLDHKISFKYIAQARIEKEYVEMYLRRYQSKEVCDYLTEELYASSQTVSESFPGHYYREVEICHNCFNVYSLIEEARAKSSHKIAMRKKAQQQQKHHQLETPPVSSAFRRKDQERVGSSGSSVEWNIAKTHLDVLVKHDFAELRSFTHPPPAVVMVTVLLIELVTGQRLDSWAEAKKNISRENFVSIVQAFHIDMLKSEQVIQLYPYLENEHFRPQIIEPISICAANICRWIFAVLRAYGVAFGHNLADPAIVSFLLSLPIKKSDEHLPLMIPNAPSQDQSLKTTIVTKHFKTPKNAGASKSKVLSNTTKRKEMKARQKIQKEHMDRLSLPQSIHTIQDQESEFPNIFTTSDGQTSLPYTIIGQSDYRISKPDLVVFHDIFDTCDATAIFFRNVVTKHLGTKALFFNYPGQAGTSWGKSTKQDVDTTNDQPSIATLNNQFIAECVHELFQHLIQTGEFALDALPFVIIGFGFGANIASCFSILYQKYYRSTFKQLFLLNGFAAVDTTLAAILHSTISVFSCFPVTRPDLPISYFTKFLFSERYLEKVDPNLVLNLYTAVSNSITLNGRIQLCKGALHHVDVSSRLPEIQVPLIVFQSVDNNLIQPSSVDPFFRGRQCTHIWSHQHQEASAGLSDKTKAQLQSIILPQEQTSGTSSSQPPAFVIWLKAGHELRQEGKRQILDVLDAILGETIIPTNDLPEAITSSTTLEKPVASLSTSSIQKKTLSRKIDILPLSSLRTNLQPVKPTEDLPKKEDRDDNKESSTEIAMTVVATTEMDQTERAFQQALEQHRQQKCQDLERKKNHPIVKPTSKPQPAFPERRTIIHPPVASTTSGSGSSATRVESEIQKIHVKIKQQEQRHEKERMKKGIHNQQIVDDQLTTLRREQDQRRERWQDEDDARIAALNAELYGYDVERQNTSANVLADLDAEEHQTYDDMNHEIKTTKPVELPDRPRSPSDLDFPQNPVLNPDLNPVVLTRDEHKVLTQASAAPRSSGRSAAAPSQDQKSNSPQLPKVEKHKPKVEKHKPKVENKTQEPEIITPLTSEEFQLVKREVHVANKERERRHADLSAKELLALRQTKATVIQSIARMNLAKTTIRLRREALARAQLEAFAGELVTRVARGYLGRRLTQMLRVIRSRHEEYTKASLNVQRVFRGHVVRNQVLEIKSEAKSVEIQRVFRGHVGRSRARVARGARETLLHQHALATKIQSSWRMRVARDDYLEQRAFSFAALEIQRVFRGHVARKKVRRQREWLGAEPGPERLELGLSLISASKEAFEHQRQDIDALHRAQELAEARVSEIHLDLRESEKELGVLEHELAELDQIEKDLQELTNEQEMLANEGAQEDTVPLGSGVLSSSSSFMAAQGSSHALNVVHTPDTYGFESKEAMRKRQAEKYAVEMAIHLKKSEREQKKKDLEAEFTNVFQDVERKRVALGEMEGKIAEMEITRLRKDREFARLQRNLMELVEEQKYELEQVREKGIELETAVATSAAAASAAAEKQLANQERSNAMYQRYDDIHIFTSSYFMFRYDIHIYIISFDIQIYTISCSDMIHLIYSHHIQIFSDIHIQRYSDIFISYSHHILIFIFILTSYPTSPSHIVPKN